MMSYLIQKCSWVAASVADAAAVNPNGIKTLLANGISTCSIKSKPVFSNSSKSLLKILVIVQFYATGFLIILH